MRKLDFTGIILQPSIFSFTFVFLTSCIIFAFTFINLGNSNDYIFNLLLGSDSPLELVDTTKSTLDSISQLIFNNQIVNRLLFFSFWLLVGLVVYVLLTGAGLGFSAAKDIIESDKLLNAHKKELQQNTILRLTLRAVALVAWFIYFVLFFKLFLPFSLLAFHASFGGVLDLYNIMIGLLGFVILALSLHLHIVLLRCTLLKPRVVGGWDDIISAHLT